MKTLTGPLIETYERSSMMSVRMSLRFLALAGISFAILFLMVAAQPRGGIGGNPVLGIMFLLAFCALLYSVIALIPNVLRILFLPKRSIDLYKDGFILRNQGSLVWRRDEALTYYWEEVIDYQYHEQKLLSSIVRGTRYSYSALMEGVAYLFFIFFIFAVGKLTGTDVSRTVILKTNDNLTHRLTDYQPTLDTLAWYRLPEYCPNKPIVREIAF
jgi:hypothetical protein